MASGICSIFFWRLALDASRCQGSKRYIAIGGDGYACGVYCSLCNCLPTSFYALGREYGDGGALPRGRAAFVKGDLGSV